VGHLANVCRTAEYFVKLFKENKKFKSQKREAHTMDASMDPFQDDEMTTYVAEDNSPGESHGVLLDSASTHTILREKSFFGSNTLSNWKTKRLLTMGGLNVFRFQEGRAKVIMPEGTTITCMRALYSPSAPRSLISY